MSRPLAMCSDRSGFLFAHACEQPAAGACTRCGRPICFEHTRMTTTGPACITCLRGEHDTRDRTSDSGSSSSTSGESETTAAQSAFAGAGGAFGGGGASADLPPEGGPRDDPYFYGTEQDRAGSYDADDFHAFDAPAAAAAGEADAPETDTGAS